MRTERPVAMLAVALLAPSCTFPLHVRGAVPAAASSALPASHRELRLLNAGLLRCSANEPVVLLRRNAGGSVDPETVLVDIENGSFHAATLTYPTSVTVEDARASINAVYGKYELRDLATPEGGVWRNEDERFAIGLAGDADGTRVMYLTFQPTSEVLKDVSRALSHGPPAPPTGSRRGP
jgi:hypothetical protein